VNKEILKKKRIMLLIICVIALGITPLALRGLQFGMDFRGGTMINLQLEREATTAEMSAIVEVLTRRVNAYGLRDMSVTPQEAMFIRVEVAETDPSAIETIKSIIGQQGHFETLYEGEVVLRGEGIVEVITNPQQGFGARRSNGGYEWNVPFRITTEAAREFSSAVEGECTQRIGTGNCEEVLYMYIDRPDGAVVLMTHEMYQEEREISISLSKERATPGGKLFTIEEVMEKSGAKLIVTDELTEEVLNKTQGEFVIIPEGVEQLQNIENAERIREVRHVGDYWAVDALNLENIVHLTPGVTSGRLVTQPSITGHAESLEEAQEEMNRIQILLKSGRLPIGVQVESVDNVSAVLGERFLNYSLLAGIIAIITVVSIVFIRYRKREIVLPLFITSFSEVIIILGAAALIGWQIDLPAVAGIIAVIGTGVDHLIIITDEAVGETKMKSGSMIRRVKRAFSIIVRATTTTIFAMFPLLFMGLGALQGFAITTILGSLIGVLITRPAYGTLVKELL